MVRGACPCDDLEKNVLGRENKGKGRRQEHALTKTQPDMF